MLVFLPYEIKARIIIVLTSLCLCVCFGILVFSPHIMTRCEVMATSGKVLRMCTYDPTRVLPVAHGFTVPSPSLTISFLHPACIDTFLLPSLRLVTTFPSVPKLSSMIVYFCQTTCFSRGIPKQRLYYPRGIG